MQIDPWRQQLQQLYAQGVFGGRDGYQASAGPATHQAYAMSGQGQFLNPAQAQPPASNGSAGGVLGGNYGGGISGMIQQYLEQLRAQQQGSANLQLPRTMLPRTPGLLEAY